MPGANAAAGSVRTRDAAAFEGRMSAALRAYMLAKFWKTIG